MDLTLPFLYEKVIEIDPTAIEVLPNAEPISLSHVQIYSEQPIVSNMLYVITSSELLSLCTYPGSVIIIGGGDEVINLCRENGFEAILLENEDCAPLVYQEICNTFFQFSRFENEIMNAIVADDGLNSILNIVSLFLGYPVFITDTALRVISSSDYEHHENEDIFLASTIDTGISNIDVMNTLKDRGIIDVLDKSDKALLIEEPPIAAFICANFMESDVRVASITIASDMGRQPNHRLLPVVQKLTELLAVPVRREGTRYYMQSTNIERMILDMLGGKMLDKRLLQHNLNAKHWHINDSYLVVKVEVDKKDVLGGTAEYTRSLASELFPDALVIDLTEAFVLVIHNAEQDAITSALNMELAGVLDRRKSVAGVSMLINDFSLLGSAYKHCGIAIEKGSAVDSGKSLYFYADFFVAHIIDMCANETDIVSLCHPDMLRLYRYDIEHDTNLLESLFTYISDERSLASASKKLQIHRNTLVYRLAKIDDMHNINLDDNAMRFHILFSYQVIKHLTDASGGNRQVLWPWSE